MSELKYDKELPIWVSYSSGDHPVARFRRLEDANRYRDTMMSEGVVIDTTPKPKIPEGAEFILVEDGDQSLFAWRGDQGWWLAGNGHYSEKELLEFISEQDEVTVLVRKEEL